MSKESIPSSPSVDRPRPRGSGHLWPAMRALLRTRIAAGLLTVIPIWVTWVVVKFVFDMMRSLTEPLAEKVAAIVIEANKELVPERVLGVLEWGVPALAVLLTLFFLYFLGLLGASVFGRRLLRAIENFFDKVPIVKTVYRSTKQVVVTVGGADGTRKFKRVVLVPFPNPNMKCLAFMTAILKDTDTGRYMAAVFIATTPNPTTGYMQFVPLEEVSELDWSIEDAVKILISGGILSPQDIAFDKVHPVRAETIAELCGEPASARQLTTEPRNPAREVPQP